MRPLRDRKRESEDAVSTHSSPLPATSHCIYAGYFCRNLLVNMDNPKYDRERARS